MADHPVFSKFQPFSGTAPHDCDADFIGMISHKKYVPWPIENGRSYQHASPSVDEEYFEWIDVLESVDRARDSYTVVEVGAGYGRWACRGAIAARQLGIETIRIGAVEAEPSHIVWAEEHFERNGFRPDQFEIYPVAVGSSPGKMLFYVNRDSDAMEESARKWYGQALVKHSETINPIKSPDYHGRRVFTNAAGQKLVQVKVELIQNILADFDEIDLIDFDIQGVELEVIRPAIVELEQKARMVHIGTHGHEIEDGLRSLFSSRGWISRFDFRCQGENDTPYGKVSFVDGVQSWDNPRFLVD